MVQGVAVGHLQHRQALEVVAADVLVGHADAAVDLGALLADDAQIWIEPAVKAVLPQDIMAGKRIGVDYAGECAEWPWRFWLANSPFHK